MNADGSAVDGSTANIGAAVAINLIKVTTQSFVGTNALIASHGLS